MKKILVILLALLVLSACSSNDKQEVKVLCPAGAPSLAFYTEINNSDFHTGDAASILPELKGKGDSEVIVIDTVNGIKALNDGSEYLLAANITFGNFYIAATGNDEDGIMNDGDYIVVFSSGATPDLVFHYIYGNDLDSNLHYVQAVSDASACLIKGINISDDTHSIDEEPYVDYVMIAEPALSAALSANKNASVYANIQQEYENKSSGKQMIMASVFVKKDFKDASAYLNNLENNINALLADPSLFEKAVNEANLSDDEIKEIFGLPNSKLASKVLNDNSIGLGYKNAYDNKQAIDNYISLFAMKETDEEIYFK